MTILLSVSSLAGTARTLVAVGTARLAVMLVTVRAAAPRSLLTSVPSGSGGDAAGAGGACGAGGAGGAGAGGAGAGVGVWAGVAEAADRRPVTGWGPAGAAPLGMVGW